MGLAQYQYNEGDSEWFSTFLARVEKQSKGYIGISLTNYNTSTVCAIAAGSVVEINGALFICSAETSVSGSIATGLNYIILSVTGTTASPYFSQAVGTWDEDKQGWYTGNARYIGGFDSDGSDYDDKWVYETRDIRTHQIKDSNITTAKINASAVTTAKINNLAVTADKLEKGQGLVANATAIDVDGIVEQGDGFFELKGKIIEIGDWNMDSTISVTVAHGLTLGKIRTITALVRNDDNDVYYPLNSMANLADPSLLAGGVTSIGTTNITLNRRTGGIFDGTSFDSTLYNRGWVTIWYVV